MILVKIPKDIKAHEKADVAQEIRKLEEIEYGIKEFLSGLLVGLVLGFVIALFLLS